HHPTLGGFDIVRQPINMTNAPQLEALKPAPDPGQHTEEVLESIGYDADTIASLRQRGLV
ncbi:MAG: CoA transferase, partial [Hyphomicrobiaceae bacterium]